MKRLVLGLALFLTSFVYAQAPPVPVTATPGTAANAVAPPGTSAAAATVNSGTAAAPVSAGTAPAPYVKPDFKNMKVEQPKVEFDGPPVAPENLAKAQKFCQLTTSCNKFRPGKAAQCVKTNLKASGLLDHIMGGDQAKDLARFFRHEGFVDLEYGLKDFTQVPDGAVLVLDAHDPLKDKRPSCPKVYGNAVVKCGNHWIDDHEYALDFHMTRGCRTKGIWLKPELVPPKPKSTVIMKRRES